MAIDSALLAEIEALDVTSAYGPIATPREALDILHDLATDQNAFKSEREALLWCVAVALAPLRVATP